MKKTSLLAIIILFISSVSNIFAQNEMNDQDYNLWLGLSIAGKSSSVISVVPVGRQAAFSFEAMPDFGIAGYYSLSDLSNIGLNFDLGLQNHNFAIKDQNMGTSYLHSISYYTLGLYLNSDGLLIGFNIGIPSSAYLDKAELKVDIAQTLSEVRFGYIYTLHRTPKTKINIYAIAGVTLNYMFIDYAKNDPLADKIIFDPEQPPITNADNPRVGSLAIGFQYVFGL